MKRCSNFQYINDPSSLSNTFYNKCCSPNPTHVPINCNSIPGCILTLNSECIIYNGESITSKGIFNGQNLNEVILALSINAGGIPQVYTQNSSTITWSGNGTQLNPLIATVIGNITPTLQSVTTQGNTTTTDINISATNPLTEVSQYTVTNTSSQSNSALQVIYDSIGSIGISQLLLQGNDSNRIIFSNNDLLFRLDDETPVATLHTDGRMTGSQGTGNNDFVTLIQIPKTGISTQSGNGILTTFNIPHGLGVTPSFKMVQAGSVDAANILYITADVTNIIVNYSVAPSSGTNNLIFNWQVKI